MKDKFKINDVVSILKGHAYEGCFGEVVSNSRPQYATGQRFYEILIRNRNTGVRVVISEDSLAYSFATVPFPVLSQCEHTYALYTGLTDTFEFCTLCDERKIV